MEKLLFLGVPMLKPIWVGYAEQSLFMTYVMLDKTYSQHRLCWKKLIPGIGNAEQNLIWDLVVKICNTRRFLSTKMISEIK